VFLVIWWVSRRLPARRHALLSGPDKSEGDRGG
jgi:hypothetical protein